MERSRKYIIIVSHMWFIVYNVSIYWREVGAGIGYETGKEATKGGI